MGEAYVNMEYVLKVEARAEAAEKQLAEAQALLRSAGAAGFAMREQLADAQERIAELERLVVNAGEVIEVLREAG